MAWGRWVYSRGGGGKGGGPSADTKKPAATRWPGGLGRVGGSGSESVVAGGQTLGHAGDEAPLPGDDRLVAQADREAAFVA